MTDTLSLEIARFFEPEPTLKSVFWKYVIERSPSNMSATALDSGALAEIVEGWQPRPYTDAEICVRILKWMLDSGMGLSALEEVSLELAEFAEESKPWSERLEQAVAQAAAALIRKELKNV